MGFFRSRTTAVFLTSALLLLAGAAARADDYTSASFIVRDPVIDAGGGYSSSASFQNFSKITQTIFDRDAGTSFINCNGFLYFEGATRPVAAATAGSSQATLSWTASTAVCSQIITGYEVGTATVSGGPYTYQNVGNVLSHIKSSLANGTTYYFVVRALSGTTILATSSQVSATPAGGGGGGGGGGSYAPSGNVIINTGAVTTSSRDVTLTFSVSSDTTRVALSNYSDLRDAVIENLPQNKSWDLCRFSGVAVAACNDGSHVVYARFYNAAGRASSIVTSSINLLSGAPPPVAPPPVAETCATDCNLLTYDLFIVNPDGTERHTGSDYVRVRAIAPHTVRYSFEDSGTDMDYNDVEVDVKKEDCRRLEVTVSSLDASWHHQVKMAISYNGVLRRTAVVLPDDHVVLGSVVYYDAGGPDICGTGEPPPVPVTPPVIPPADTGCRPADCGQVSYDLYIINPDGSERHTGSPYVKVGMISDGAVRHFFEDSGSDMDFNDVVIDVDKSDCRRVTFTESGLDAGWHHQVRLVVYYQGLKKTDSLVWPDTQAAAGKSIALDAGGPAVCGPEALLPSEPSANFQVGDLIKGPAADTVYYYGRDGKRHTFPNINVFKSWYADFSAVRQVDNDELSAVPLGPNVGYKPGVRLVKLMTDPRVYAVAAKNVLRWLMTENVAALLYGDLWRTKVDDLLDSLFADYTYGEPIGQPGDFDPAQLRQIKSIDESQDFPDAGLSGDGSAAGATAGATPSCTTATVFTDVMGLESDNIQVRPLQVLLQCLGFFPADITPTGFFGPITEKAVVAFQEANGLSSSGMVTSATWSVLNRYSLPPVPATAPPAAVPVVAAPVAGSVTSCTTETVFTDALEVGSVNVQVRPLQALLQCLGFFPADITPTGFFGPTTEQSVIAFQKANSLTQNGIVGPATRDKLNSFGE